MYRAVRTSVFARLLLAATLLAGTMLNTAGDALSNTATDWPTYLHDVQRQAASAETFLSTSNAGLLTPLWTYKTGGTVGASPTIVNNVVYEGSWDGYEYALNATNGQVLWKTYLGVTNVSGCVPPNAGVDSSAAVQNGVVYVGGGGNESGSNTSYWYALDASTGNILWKVPIGDNSPSGGNFNWSSPLLYNGYAYIGVASLGDCPLVQGKLLKVSLSTHQVVAEADLAAAGNRGNGVWTSPSVDPATNTIVVSTGTWDYQGDPLGQAVISLNADTLAVIGHWQPPLSEQVFDGDFGVTPLLYTDANGRQMVATINKNGIVYALQEGNLGAGPVWQQQISTVESPGNVSSGAYGQGLLFEAGSGDVINGTQYYGSINAFDPTTGQFIWRVGLQHDVTPPLAYMNGLILLGDGPNFEIRNASNGDLLYAYTTPSDLYAAPSISNGRIFLGTTDGRIIAFGLNTTPPPAPVPGQPLSLPFNNEGVSNNGSATSTNYDNVGYTYSSQALAAAGINSGGTATANGVTFQWPTTGPGMNDNAIAQGQTITLTSPTGGSALAFLGSATNGPSSGTGSILYTDGTSQAFNLTFSDWTLNGGNATGPDPSNSIAAHVTYRNNSQGEADLVATYLFSASVQLQAGKQVQAVILPQGANTGLLHVFAITLVTPSSAASSTPSPTSSPTATATLTPTTTSTGTPTATATASATAPTPTRTPTVKGHGKGHK